MTTRERAGGRAARLKMHADGPQKPQVWPGVEGGRYKPLTDRDVERIHRASLDILEKVGIADPTAEWRERIVAAGGWVTAGGRLCIPGGLVEDCIARAGRGFTVRGREPRHDLDVSGTRVHLGGGSATLELLDAKTNGFRETTLVDLYDNSRLEDALDNIHFVIRSCIARDIVAAEDLDINTAYAVMSATSKHMVTSFFQPEHLEAAVSMFDISLGGDGSGARWQERPFATAIVPFTVPPLRFAPDACQVLDAAARNGMPAVVTSAGQAGATAPAALAGTLVQGNAEVLAGLTAINLLKPGHPLFMGNFPLVVDLRSGAFAGGSGEMALLAAGAAQMARFYDIPSFLGAGMSSSKQPDVQAGWEKGYLTVLPALAGCNMISQTAGALADLMAFSRESLTIDNDMLSGVLRAVRGIEVTDTSLSVETMADVVAGDGHFLGHGQTLSLMRTEYVYPELADRKSIEEWVSSGSEGIRERGRKMMREIFSTHYPDYVPPEADVTIREKFNIMLARKDMRPGNTRW